jgi:hypothetical protein
MVVVLVVVRLAVNGSGPARARASGEIGSVTATRIETGNARVVVHRAGDLLGTVGLDRDRDRGRL